MAKTVGIDVGDYSIKAVELDGSYKKVRLLRCQVERVPEGEAADPAQRAGALATAIKHALKEAHIHGADLRLGHPCREAVLRMIEVPFTGHDAIKKVIKSEVEGSIHSHSVDDMVVDFYEIGKGAEGEGSKVMVAAVPKPGLRNLLTALEQHGIEPEIVDLDIMALFRAAQWCGAFEVEAAPASDVALPVEADADHKGPAAPASRLCAVLDLGARSTRILLVEDGNLVDMRALRVGDAAVAEELVQRHGLAIDVARQAVAACLATGSAFHADVAAQTPAVAVEGAAPAPAPIAAHSVVIEPEEVAAAQTALLQRLARELVRFLAGVRAHNKISDLWITGGATHLAGMREMLQEVFGVEPRDLDVLGRLQHSLPEEEAASLAPVIATAVGLALGGLGGVEGFNFRQEDLAFTRGYDRVKFPLAIFCMVALFTVLVWGFKLNTDLKLLEHRVGCTFVGDTKKPAFFGMLNQVLSSGWFAENYDKAVDSANTENKDKKVRLVKFKELLQEVAAKPVEDRLAHVKNRLNDVAKALQSKVGVYEDLTLESGLAVLVRFAEVLKAKEPELGRFLLLRVKLNLPPRTGRSLEFTIAFRGNDFRNRLGILRQALHDECSKVDSPFKEDDDKSLKESPFTDNKESGVQGSYYELKLVVRDEFSEILQSNGAMAVPRSRHR